MAESAKIELTALDRRILKVLQEDGRMTIQAVADRVGLSASPCLRRIRRMEQAGIITAVFWLIWGLVFRRYAAADDEETILNRSLRWLMRGSILELLIAVPSHVIVRRRDDCCAPLGTFWGIATGISVMLLCFGPGVFFLFVKRMRQLKPQVPSRDKPLAEPK